LIQVDVLAALPGRRPGRQAEEPDRPVVLRDSARAALLAALGEPDLAAREASATAVQNLDA
jgi:hypothetical protein